MSFKSLCVALSALAFVVVSASSAWASNNPIPGIDVVVKKKPACNAVARATTDAKAEIVVPKGLAKSYTLTLTY